MQNSLSSNSQPQYPEFNRGVLFAIAAYLMWGVFPLYFKQLASMSAYDVVAWRVILSAVSLLPILYFFSPKKEALQALKNGKQLGLVVAATLLISTNWIAFVEAVSSGQILQSSLGYFLVPIINVALGIIVFGETPNNLRRLAIVTAALGMLATFIVAGFIPWLSLIMAVTFGLYGMVRKLSAIDSATGLFLESVLLIPVALWWIASHGDSAFHPNNHALYWLPFLGIVTIVPLLSMVAGAKRIPMSTLGFVQYITPCLHFLTAAVIYNETLDAARLIAFSTTLLAVALWLAGARKPKAAKTQQ